MLIEQRYQCYIHACSGNCFWKYFSALFPLFFRIFLCEVSGRYVWGCLDGYPESPDGYFGCPDDTVSSSGHLWFLSGQPCFRNRLRGRTSGRYLCSVRTVNPVGLNRFLPAPQLTFWPPFVLFCRLVRFSTTFYA
jgi:hypothetical protein